MEVEVGQCVQDLCAPCPDSVQILSITKSRSADREKTLEGEIVLVVKNKAQLWGVVCPKPNPSYRFGSFGLSCSWMLRICCNEFEWCSDTTNRRSNTKSAENKDLVNTVTHPEHLLFNFVLSSFPVTSFPFDDIQVLAQIRVGETLLEQKKKSVL